MSLREDHLFRDFVEQEKKIFSSDSAKAINLLKKVNLVLGSRYKAFNTDLRKPLIYSVSHHLQNPIGACGSFTSVLTRSLQEVGIKARICQMYAKGYYGAHIVLEANIENKWVVLDPLYNLFFVTPEGKLASFREVSTSWGFFSDQIPKEIRFPYATIKYDEDYRYESVRYTNWNKIPILLPAIKKISKLILGPEIEYFSLRSYFLNTYYILTLLLTIGYVLALLLIMRFEKPTN